MRYALGAHCKVEIVSKAFFPKRLKQAKIINTRVIQKLP